MGTIESLLRKLERSPVEVDGVTIGAFDLQSYLSNALSESPRIAEIPGHVLRFSQGNWSALAETAQENRQLEISLMPWAMDCASGGIPRTSGQIARGTGEPGLPAGGCDPCAFLPGSL